MLKVLGVPGCAVRMHPALSCEGPQRATALGPILQGPPTRRLLLPERAGQHQLGMTAFQRKGIKEDL
jgi:hypothetical protein